MKTQTDCPSWLTEPLYKALWDKNTNLQLIETDSLTEPGRKLEAIVKPPDDIAYSMSGREMSNLKDRANDLYKAQTIFADRCIVAKEPLLEEELKNPETATRQKIAIGMIIGQVFPMPEARLKKSLKKPA